MNAATGTPTRAHSLGELLAPLELAPLPAAVAATTVSDLTQDSRHVVAGGLFLALRGKTRHGLAFLPQALAQGARAVLWDDDGSTAAPQLPPGVVGLGVTDLAAHAGVIADRYFDAPSAALWVAGVTGTNGKTTVAWLVAQALDASGRRAGYIGTLGAGPIGDVRASSHTTPDAVSVQRELAALRAAGAMAVAMEVSSHALDQQRVAGVRFRSAALTNLTRDHLDYHGTMQAYADAKSRLFDWPGLGTRVLNVDDALGAALATRLDAPGRVIVTGRAGGSAALIARLATQGAGWVRAEAVELAGSGQRIRIDSHLGRCELRSSLIGDFNTDNLLTALAVLLSCELPLDRAVRALADATAPAGRMQALGGGAQPLAIVDYAHTPDALAKALQAARGHARGRVIVVFGCGGERDAGKRPLMAAVAAELADEIVITDDNPRREAPAAIVAAIVAGLPAGRTARIVHDRAEAIGSAIAAARAGDIVLVAGKGHEESQVVGAERRAFSDQAVVRAALERRAGVPA
ncbi:MAG: UDP-N-acetylmuramoyl-L-alanyl-D-glutamate--2,6-diaminopimelate ligase [Steroidobacteraceae bacterium]